jgi:hypothetical protein
MTSYSDLVSCEAGKAENLSTHFKLSRLEDCKAWQAFGKTTGKRSRTKLLRIYIAGSMPTGNTHSGHFNIGKQYILTYLTIFTIFPYIFISNCRN